MPGKHFFAVFLHVPAWSFERLPIPYRDSLSLPLKMTYSGLGQVTWRKATELTKKRLTRCQAQLNNTLNFLRFPLLQKQCNSRIFRAKLPGRNKCCKKCRELLGQIRNLTYIVEGLENCIILEEVIEKLEICHHLLLGSAPKENGVILEAPVKPSRVDLKRKKPGKKEKKVHFKKLPVP